MTCHPAFNDKLPTFWAVKSNIQVSGELTTSRGPGTSFEFAITLVEQLFGEFVAKAVAESLVRYAWIQFTSLDMVSCCSRILLNRDRCSSVSTSH